MISIHHIKLWCDPWYNHPLEVKGGQIVAAFDTLIFTSNYSLAGIYGDCEIDFPPLQRRIQERNFDLVPYISEED